MTDQPRDDDHATNYGLVHDFDIDDSRLEGSTKQWIFMLGFDLGSVVCSMQHGLPFEMTVRVPILDVIASVVREEGRVMRVCGHYDDEHETMGTVSYAQIRVEGADVG